MNEKDITVYLEKLLSKGIEVEGFEGVKIKAIKNTGTVLILEIEDKDGIKQDYFVNTIKNYVTSK